jgi:ankyrin repeat protein
VLNAMLLGVIESDSPVATAFTKTLLLKGAAADTWAPSGLSALMIAAAKNKTNIMELLINNQGTAAAEQNGSATETGEAGEKGAKRTGGKASTAAAASAAGGVAKDGSDVQLPDGQRRTALMHAAAGDHLEAIQLLLNHGAEARSAAAPML